MQKYMQAALQEAQAAGARGEVPIGAVIVDPESGEIIARAGNRTRELSDPSAHAEMLCIREACEKSGAQRIPGLDLYVTLEPCTMCAGAISFARLRKVVFGASDKKGGACSSGVKFFEASTCHHRPELISGMMRDDCAAILKEFFKARR